MSRSKSQAAPPKWDENPFYLAAISLKKGPGVPQSMDESRRSEYSTVDRTNLIPGQVYWSDDDLPEILDVKEPPAGWREWALSHEPTDQINPQSHPRQERSPVPGHPPRILRKFDVLPKQIFTGEKGWAIEAWMRLDPTITYDDIQMRMYIDGRPSVLELRLRRQKARSQLGLDLWEAQPVDYTAQHELFRSRVRPSEAVRAHIQEVDPRCVILRTAVARDKALAAAIEAAHDGQLTIAAANTADEGDPMEEDGGEEGEPMDVDSTKAGANEGGRRVKFDLSSTIERRRSF